MAYRLGATASRIVWAILFLTTASLAVILSSQSYRAAQSKNWPTTEGIVVSYQNKPNYRYSVQGHNYECSHVSCNEFVISAPDLKPVDRNAVRYFPGNKVTVHYLPQDPTIAVLEADFDTAVLKAIAILCLVSSVFATGFVRGWRVYSSRRSILGNDNP